ncbi:MAG: hypothetical protein AAB518_02450 [Patescibacteria group bacterium]
MHRLRKFWQFLAISALTALPLTVSAQVYGPQPAPGGPPSVNLTFDGIKNILETVLRWMYTLFFVIAAIMIVWAAFNYLTSGGDEEKVEKAKKGFIYAIVAIAVAIVSASVKVVVANILGVPAVP